MCHLRRLIVANLALIAFMVCLGAPEAYARIVAPVMEAPSRTSKPVLPRVHLNQYQLARLDELLGHRSSTTPGTLRVLALQVEYSDTLMAGYQDSLFFANELRHVSEYFTTASAGQLDVQVNLDPVVYRLPKTAGYYGRDLYEEVRVVELVQTLIGMNDDTTDYSNYDFVFIIHAGAGQETDLAGDSQGAQVWSSFYDSSDIDNAIADTTVAGLATNDSLGGVPFTVNSFCVVPADASQDFAFIGTLGIWVYQVCNRIGMLPLFDNTPGPPDSQGVGNFCVMSYGLFNVDGFIPSFPCAFNRMLAGWIDPITLDATADAGVWELKDINTAAASDTACVRIPISESEYYLVVNRAHDSNFDSLFTFNDLDSDLIPDPEDSLLGAEFDFFLTDLSNPSVRVPDPRFPGGLLKRHTGSGIYIWHVDENVIRSTVASGFLPDDFVDRKGVDLEEADGVQDLDGPGASAFALGGHWDSYRAGDGNQTRFAADTNPGSAANSGVESWIVIDRVSEPGPVMTFRLGSSRNDFTDVRVRWSTDVFLQPPTPIQWDGSGDTEVVVLGSEGVFVFNSALGEFDDGDADPNTINPLIPVSGVRWMGPPAFGDIDGGGDTEMVAGSTDGRVFAWKIPSGVQVTGGVLYVGSELACPVMLSDVDADGVLEIAVAEVVGDSIRIGFVTGSGNPYPIVDPDFDPLWPAMVPGQRAAPMTVAVAGPGSAGRVAVVIASIDSTTARAHVTSIPVAYRDGQPHAGGSSVVRWRESLSVSARIRDFYTSAPATGDIDSDGYDEVVLSTADGQLIILEDDADGSGRVDRITESLRSKAPSAPVLGDVDQDGTLEIAIWDQEWMYLLKPNGEVATNWPKRIIPDRLGEQPPAAYRHGLESPVIADLGGNGVFDIIYPLRDGTVHAYDVSGAPSAGFPRIGVGGVSATPSLAALQAGGGLYLLSLGALDRIAGLDAIGDVFADSSEAILSVQNLPGTSAGDATLWSLYGGGTERAGRAVAPATVVAGGEPFSRDSFMIYPNPVTGDDVHVRVTTNAAAGIRVDVYNLEGESTFSQSFTVNPNGLFEMPFDEVIDVSRLASGVYYVRLYIESTTGGESLVKPFAIRR